ncbi:hypothetical protein C1H46_015708 [Malus baccata]|uniref:GB1/RHD3-type G domain-containing protein n=1 Tax=Malus baccata TaxID=106549 RepID=A0A540MIQ7_MALBA|nr:hypothetical protein C1H46_015708 [Malus baccata]
MMKEDACATQLICGNGEFNPAALDRFVKKVKFDKCGISYAVVAIMGPQGSGKSTLMNHLFDTGFQEMKIECGQSQTTKGIWIAKYVGIEPCTIALDLEGSDSTVRGEDDTTFEKQIALFALAVSDILLINMWYNDIGREQASGKPLLKTIFQVMMRLFRDTPKKTTLIFVVRDMPSKAPFELLENRLKEDTQKMWDEVSKQAHEKSPLAVFFNVQVVALSNYLDKEETFKEEVAQLRQRVVNSISPGGLFGDREGVVPASDFSLSAQNMWGEIKLNKDLDLPAHKVMVATVRCEEISTDIFKQLKENEGWLVLQNAAETGPVPDFGGTVSSILYTYLSKYDEKALYYDEGVKNSKRQILESKALDSAYITYLTMLRHLHSKALGKFKVRLEQSLKEGSGSFNSSAQNCIQSSMHDFDQECKDAAIQQANWDFSSIRNEHCRDLLSEVKVNYEKQFSESLTKQVEALLKGGGGDFWASIRIFLNRNDVLSEFSAAIVHLEENKERLYKLIQNFRDYARQVVEEKAKYEAEHSVLIHMKARFSAVFNYDSNSIPRIWNKKGDIRTITKDARSASLKILSAMAAIRLSEKPDNIEKVLFSSLMDETEDPLKSRTWEEVSSKDTLITPRDCKLLWGQFIEETEYIVNKASSLHVKIAKAKCEQIATNKFNQLIKSKGWLALEEAAKTGPVPGFGKSFNSILDTCISDYDKEVADFDEGVRNSLRQLWKSKALNFAQGVYVTTLPHLCSEALDSFKLGLEESLKKRGQLLDSSVRTYTQSSMNKFEQGCADAPLQLAHADISSLREKLRADMFEHAASVFGAKWSRAKSDDKRMLYFMLARLAISAGLAAFGIPFYYTG